MYASQLSSLGVVMGTQERGRDFYSLYLEPAFVSANWVRRSGRRRCCDVDGQAVRACVLAPGPDLALSSLCSTRATFSTWSTTLRLMAQVHCCSGAWGIR